MLKAEQIPDEVVKAALVSMKEMAEYWIHLGMPEKGASKERYDTWLALGHHSNAMNAARAALGDGYE